MNGKPLGDAIDHELLNEMVRVFNLRKESDPVIIDWQHATSPFQEGVQGPDAGNALGIIVDLELKEDGLYAIPAYNERGLKVVNEAGGILWSSPEYLHGEIFTRDGGDKVGDAQLLAITLTPRPAQQSDKIDRVILKENLSMYSKEQLNAMDHDDLVDFANREQDLNRQKDEMIKQLEKQVKSMNEDNEAKIAQDNEELGEKSDKEEKLGEHSDKEEKKNEHYEKKEHDEEEKDKKMNEHKKMSESLASPALLSEIQMLREQVQQLRQEKIEVEKTTAVNQLLSEGKISPNEEAVAREAYDMKEHDEEEKDKKMNEHKKMSESLASPALLSEIQMLREQVQQLRQEKIEVEKTTAVNQLLSEGKISPNEEAVAREAYDMKLEGRDSFWNMFSERQSNSVVPMTTIGHGASGQEINKETLNLKIKKLSEDKGISFSQALTEFRSSNPSEYNQAYGV